MRRAIASLLAAAAFGAAGLAHGQIVVIVHPSAPALSADEIKALYLGRNNELKPVDYAEASPIRSDFYAKLTGRDTSQVKATWARLVFTGKGRPPRQLPDADAVKKAVAADPKAIGYVDKAQADSSVKVVLTLN